MYVFVFRRIRQRIDIHILKLKEPNSRYSSYGEVWPRILSRQPHHTPENCTGLRLWVILPSLYNHHVASTERPKSSCQTPLHLVHLTVITRRKTKTGQRISAHNNLLHLSYVIITNSSQITII